jgi:hypothetical protein
MVSVEGFPWLLKRLTTRMGILVWLALSGGPLPALLDAAQSDQAISPDVIALQPFVVYEGFIGVIDGFTGETYHEYNPVVEGFRENFNRILLGYHRRLLTEELGHMERQLRLEKAFGKDLAALADSFGMRGFQINEDSLLRIERAIMGRLLEDPFFKIEALVVWDLDRLRRAGRRGNWSQYARDIRINEETGEWERRITTTWKAGFAVPERNGSRGWYEVTKLQGLNLETNRGYHFIDRGLTGRIVPGAFRDVKLTYPILVNAEEPAPAQVARLQEAFLKNLAYIYDPFSWAWRRNMRFRGGFVQQFQRHVRSARLQVSDRDWFDPVLASFLNDLVTIQHHGINEIYDLEMLRKVPVNANILGEGLDLLNWNAGEARQVPYDPGHQLSARVHFNNPAGARFILLDAYRRYPGTFVEALRSNLLGLEKKVSGKDLVRRTIEEVSGMPADVYIQKAARVQEAELERFRHSSGAL